MSTKNKIIISVSTVCLVAVIAVVAIVAVYAATAQSFDTSIKVTYSASDEISGSAKAKYYIGNNENVTPTTMYVDGKEDSGESFDFKAGDYKAKDKTLAPENPTISLDSEENRYIVFEYVFTATTGSYTAALTYSDETSSGNSADKNVLVYYRTLDEDTKLSSAEDFDKFTSGTTFNNTLNTTVTAGTTTYVYVKVTVQTWGQDAEFSGKFHWELTAAS